MDIDWVSFGLGFFVALFLPIIDILSVWVRFKVGEYKELAE